MTEAETILRGCIERLERLLHDPGRIPPPVCQLDMDTILRSVSKETGVSWREIVGKSRRRHVSYARALFARRAYSVRNARGGSRWSHAAIADKLNRDRSTITTLLQRYAE